MKPGTGARKWRFLILAGVAAFLVGTGAKLAPGQHKSALQPVTLSSDVLKGTLLIADGSESTGGGKPTKPGHG